MKDMHARTGKGRRSGVDYREISLTGPAAHDTTSRQCA